ncbi:MAG TPA: hypothetical protein PLW02_10115 [Verrucomicrobiota bacterium]|nr:hypothetical protein [Verrucomicrobiota bacterium]
MSQRYRNADKRRDSIGVFAYGFPILCRILATVLRVASAILADGSNTREQDAPATLQTEFTEIFYS